MKIIFSISLLLILIKSGYSQTPYIDTLKSQVRLKSVPDSQRVLLISTLSAIMAYVRPDSAIMYAQEGINLSRKIGFLKGEMQCKKSIGEAMWIVGEY